jgi:hypothetical protein
VTTDCRIVARGLPIRLWCSPLGICQNSELWGKLMSKRVRQMFDFVLNRSTFSTDLVAKNEDEL